MDLLQLRYFQALAKNGNLTQTAKQLYIAPPALSVSISKLEKELGVQMFDRVGRGMVLNSQGRAFLERIDEVLTMLDYAVAELKDRKQENEETLHIATTSPNVFQASFLAFMKAYPYYRISHTWLKLEQTDSCDLLHKYNFLLASPTDFSQGGELEHRILYDTDYAVLLLPPDHPFANRREIALHEMKNEAFVALSPEYSSRKFFDAVCRAADFSPNIVLECDYTVRSHMVRQKAGVTIATAHTKVLNHCAGCVAIKINPPFIRRTQAIYWNPAHYQTRASKHFLTFVCEYFEHISFDLTGSHGS